VNYLRQELRLQAKRIIHFVDKLNISVGSSRIAKCLMEHICLLPNSLTCCQAEDSIENAFMDITINASANSFTVTSKKLGPDFITTGRFPRKIAKSNSSEFSDPTWGKGKRILVEHKDGSTSTIKLFARLPFLTLDTAIHNPAEKALTPASLQILDMKVNLVGQKLSSYGTGGLADPAKRIGSYSFAALINPATRNGLVTGWLTHEQGVGVFFPGPPTAVPAPGSNPPYTLKAQLDFGRFQVDPGKTRKTDTMLIGFFSDGRLGLEAYADAVAAHCKIKLRPRPNVYCTWYHARASDQDAIAENTRFAAKHLKPFGLNVMQIDDHWQAPLPKDFKHDGKIKTTGPIKVFVDTKPNYSKGMALTAKAITGQAMMAGIWFMPFAGNLRNPYFDKDIYAKNPDGTPFHDARWSGTCLDATSPEGNKFIFDRTKRIYDWGYRYFKIDGMHTGLATYNIYVHTGYKKQALEKAILHDPHSTLIQAYRKGLNTLHEAAPDAMILGCNTAQNMMCMGPAFGLIDAMRIGPDNGGAGSGNWGQVTTGAWHGTNLYFLNGRVWYNDPDPVYVRKKNPLNSARWMCSWLAISGAMHTSSEQYSKLDPARLDILKHCLPGHDFETRPVDLFETNQPRIWLTGNDRVNIVGLFNWNQKQETQITYDLDKLGLNNSNTYIAFDFWENKFVDSVTDQLKQTLPGGTCRVLALRPRTSYPQVISTSRHITQGLMDVLEEKWSADTKILTGKSAVVGNDPYELRIALPKVGTWEIKNIAATGANILKGEQGERGEQNEPGLRLVIKSSESKDVQWTVEFE
jgi:hypothetical protein